MKSLKLKFSLILLLALTCIVTLTSALVGFNFTSADARTVVISGSSIFYASGANVWAHKEADDEYYAMFVFDSASDKISYRKNLALHWYENAGTEDTDNSTASPVAQEGYFNIEIGFEEISFDRYIITFQTQQYAQDNEDSVTTNYIIFIPVYENEVATGDLYYIVTDDIDAEAQNANTVSSEHIYINFAEGSEGGCYKVRISNTEADDTTDYSGCDELKNIGGNYSKYSSSSTSPVIPIAFTAEFDSVDTKDAKMVLYSMNGQSFEYTSTSVDEETTTSGVTYYSSGSVTDDVAPVLCLNGGLNYLAAGEEIDLSYTIIDVLASSTASEIGYFIPTETQATGSDNLENYLNTDLYRTVKTSDDQYMILHADSYIPASGDYNLSVFDAYDCEEENYSSYLKVKGAVKVYIKVTDSSSSVSTYVMLDWYIDDDYLITSSNGTKFVALAEDGRGVSYFYTVTENKTSTPQTSADATDEENLTAIKWQAMVDAYQQLVTEAAVGLKAGEKNYFYLPSMKNITYTYTDLQGNEHTETGNMFNDNCDDYSDFTFSIYYITESSSENSTSGTADSLSITLSSNGRYRFMIYAADTSSNSMFYYDEDGELVEFSTSDIWSMREAEEDTDYEGTDKYIAWFDFEVEDSEFTISNAGEQDIAYVGSSYSIDSDEFDVNGIDYVLSYKLYYFDYESFYNYMIATDPDFEGWNFNDFQDAVSELGYDFVLTYNEYLIRIMSTLESDELNYSDFEDYEWDSSGLSFVPQDDNGYYLVVCTMTSSTYTNADPLYGCMSILASVAPDAIAGESTWLTDNLTSVILLSIAGAALIGIIVLLVVKPKDEQDLDAQLVEKGSDKKKRKKEKNK